MIVGIGVDTVDIERFRGQLRRAPRLRERLFTPAERVHSEASLAARFAAKEAAIKALGGSGRLGWHDLEIVRDAERAPSFTPTPGLVAALRARGGARLHLSLTHDAGVATAFVIAEGGAPPSAQRGTLVEGPASGAGQNGAETR